MTLPEKLNELSHPDGPHISRRTLALYCAVDHSQLCKFMKTGVGFSPARQRDIERGIQDLAQAVHKIAFAPTTGLPPLDDEDEF